MKTIFLLMTFFFPGEGWYVQPLVCEDQTCVQQIIEYGKSSGSGLYRVRVFNTEPKRYKSADPNIPLAVITEPDLDIWIH